MSSVYKIPETLTERMKLRRDLKSFVQQKALCPPLSLKQLEALADEFVSTDEQLNAFKSWLMVEINNQLWIDIVASIPHERRLLMLPKCLSKHGECKGEFDELGLLCHRCGRCLIPSLQDKAEELGVLSIVAEGFTQVINLIENNVVDAVIGVSCLDSLEKAFPLLVRHAVPGLAISLNDSGCKDTHVDEAYVIELLSMLNDNDYKLLDHNSVKEQIDRWFTKPELQQLISSDTDHTTNVCLDWMCGEGKRWRPFLLAGVWRALTGKSEMTEDVHRAAVAVECFHKASLIHDDIEDQDMSRYGNPTINAKYGDAYAINVGDALLGVGYKVLASTNNAELVRLIAEAQMKLCKGQGAELIWGRDPRPIDLDFVIFIARNKTVPAFEVSLQLGLCCTGNFAHLRPKMSEYSDAFGIAYQLKDDLDDFYSDTVESERPSAVLALRTEHPEWNDDEVKNELIRLIDQYHQSALNVLESIDNIELKRLLFQITEKILGE